MSAVDHSERPVRNLAAWGYESAASGDRVEVDVWTVNRVEGDDLPDPEDFDAPVDEVLAAAGDIAKVSYRGAAGIGYRRVSTDEAVSQNAYAGAARAAGGERTGAGTFGEGASPAVQGPSLDDVVRYGESNVLPAVRAELGELGMAVGREPSSDEDEEPVSARPFDGYRNVVRVFTRGGTFRYTVRGGRLTKGGPSGGRR